MNVLTKAMTQGWQALLRIFHVRAPVPPVIVHDPAAQGPQNLDDPFLDAKAQERIGRAIADRAARANVSARKPNGLD